MKNQVISLYDYTGEALRPWAEAGYDCFAYDIQHVAEPMDITGLKKVRKCPSVFYFKSDLYNHETLLEILVRHSGKVAVTCDEMMSILVGQITYLRVMHTESVLVFGQGAVLQCQRERMFPLSTWYASAKIPRKGETIRLYRPRQVESHRRRRTSEVQHREVLRRRFIWPTLVYNHYLG